MIGYQLQQNPQDIVPNDGLVLGARAETDLWVRQGPASRYLIPQLDVYLPSVRPSNTGIRLGARGLVQNRNALLNTNAFAPRGYDVNALPDGVYVQLEAEGIQPLGTSMMD